MNNESNIDNHNMYFKNNNYVFENIILYFYLYQILTCNEVAERDILRIYTLQGLNVINVLINFIQRFYFRSMLSKILIYEILTNIMLGGKIDFFSSILKFNNNKIDNILTKCNNIC